MTALASLLEGMDNWDKDRRFMAASDLTNDICSNGRALELSLQKRVCYAFLKQLEDNSIEVQGNAVKCLAKIVCRFQEQLVGEAAGKLSDLLLNGRPEVRDIYATCLRGLLQELKPSGGISSNQQGNNNAQGAQQGGNFGQGRPGGTISGPLVCQHVLPHILTGIVSLNASQLVKEECVDVLSEVSDLSGGGKPGGFRFGFGGGGLGGNGNQGGGMMITNNKVKIRGSDGTVKEVAVFDCCAMGPCGDVNHTQVFWQTKELCVEILTEVLRCFGNDSKPWWQEQDRFTQGLLNIIKDPNSKPGLRKKTINCLGILSSVLSDRQLDLLVQCLLQNVREGRTRTEKQLYIQCISSVARNVVSTRVLATHINQIAPLLIEICKEATSNNDGNTTAGDVDVVENCLQAFTNFIGKLKSMSEEYFETLISLVLQLIVYDPNSYGDMEDDDGNQPMAVGGDSDNEQFSDDEDPDDDYAFSEASEEDNDSWKVRRAAYKVVDAMISGMPHRLLDIYDRLAGPTIKRFHSERETNVKLDAFNTIEKLIKAAMATRRSLQGGNDGGSSSSSSTAKGSGLVMGGGGSGFNAAGGNRGNTVAMQSHVEKAVQIMPQLTLAISKQLTQNKVRQSAFGLLRVVSGLLPNQVEGNLNVLEPQLLKGLYDQTPSIVLDSLTILKNIALNYQDPAVFQRLLPKILPQLLAICQGSYYKTIAESLHVIAAAVYPLRIEGTQGQALEACRENIKVVFSVLVQKLTKTDQDHDVKEASLECFGHTQACLGDLFPQEGAACLPAFLDRLRNELTRGTAIKALRVICISPHNTPIDAEILHTICLQLLQYLQQNTRVLRQDSLDCLSQILRKYSSSMKSETNLVIVGGLCPFFGESDLYLTDIAIQVVIHALNSPANQGNTELSKVIREKCLPGIVQCCRSPLLQGGALSSTLKFFNTISFSDGEEVHSLYRSLMDVSRVDVQAQAARTVISNLAKCVAALAIVSQFVGQTLTDFVTILTESAPPPAVRNENGELIQQQQQPNLPREKILLIELSLLSLGEIGKFMDLVAEIPTVLETMRAHLRSDYDELRHAAALSLGYATMGSGEQSLSALLAGIGTSQGGNQVSADGAPVAADKERYLLLTALKEVIILDYETNSGPGSGGSDGDKSLIRGDNTKKIISMLSTHATAEDEGLRNLIAECLGYLLLIDSAATLALLEQLLGSDQPKVRATAISAVRFTASKGGPSSADQGTSPADSNNSVTDSLLRLKPRLLATLQDPDILQVRKAALQSVSALVTCNQGRLSQAVLGDNNNSFQNSSGSPSTIEQIVQFCIGEGMGRPELIREVDLGPFKHRIDDGLNNRKLSFQLILDLLPAFGEKIVSLSLAHDGVLIDHVVRGLADQEDIQIVCLNIIMEMGNNFWVSPVLVAHLDRVIEPLERGINKNTKQIQSRQNLTKASDMLRSFARCVKSLVMVELPKTHKGFADFVSRAGKDAIFQEAYEKCGGI